MPYKGVKYEPLPIFNESYRAKELEKMVASIYLDGEDKVEEIDVMTEEAFNLEVYNILKNATQEVENQYTKKENKVNSATMWFISYLDHRSVLDTLTAKYQIIEKILEETERRLAVIDLNKDTFTSVTKALLLQALVQMMEPNVICRVRKSDVSKFEKYSAFQTKYQIIPWCEKKFFKLTGCEVHVKLDKENFVNDNCYGGVIILSSDGQISVNNTLKQRFANIRQRAGSMIRIYLFGPPTKRKFLI